jgi:hypothetical protein
MQTRIQSLIESFINIGIGYFVALATQLAVFPLFGMKVRLSENLAIGGIFTVISIIRSYLVRRLFNRLHHGRGILHREDSAPVR